MHGFRKRLALLLALALAGMALAAGCSGSVSVGSQGGTAAYTNDQYGFSLTHDTRFTEGTPVAGGSAGGSSVFDVVFPDKNGTVVGGRYVDAIQVSVYELAREVKPAEVPTLKAEVQGVVDQLMSAASSAKIVEPMKAVTVNGVPGFAVKYAYSESGTELTATSYFLFKGKYEYEITVQATSDQWDALKNQFDAAVQSFTVK